MVTSKLKRTCYFVILATVIIFSNRLTVEAAEDFRLFKMVSGERERLTSIGKKSGLEKWPKSNILRTSPRIDKSLLLNPGLITRENISYPPGLFIEGTQGVLCEWHWDYFIKNPDPLPTDLPEEQKKWLLEHIPSGVKKDPNLIKEYLDKNVERYRKSKEDRLVGSIFMKVCVALDSQTANEYLIYDLAMTQLPNEAVEYYFSSARNRLEGLGTIAFSGPIRFVRDNIAVIIDARGELAGEALPLAQKIDALIQQQPVLTYQQLLARRPAITIAKEPEVVYSFKDSYRRWGVPVKVWAPDGQEIVWIGAWIDGVSKIYGRTARFCWYITRPVL